MRSWWFVAHSENAVLLLVKGRNIESSPSQPLKQCLRNCRLHDHFILKPLFSLYSARRFKTERMVWTIHRMIQPLHNLNRTKQNNILSLIIYTTQPSNSMGSALQSVYVCTYFHMWCTVCAHITVYSTRTCLEYICTCNYRWMAVSLFVRSSWPSS